MRASCGWLLVRKVPQKHIKHGLFSNMRAGMLSWQLNSGRPREPTEFTSPPPFACTKKHNGKQYDNKTRCNPVPTDMYCQNE